MKTNTNKLNFYDVKAKKKFVPKSYTVKTKSGRKFGVAKGPSGIMCWRILGKKDY